MNMYFVRLFRIWCDGYKGENVLIFVIRYISVVLMFVYLWDGYIIYFKIVFEDFFL